MSPESTMVSAARAGDHEAFSRLVALYQRPVYSLCYRMLGNVHDAEDAAQDTFLKSYRALGSYDAERSFSTWLLSIAAHNCIDRLRRRRENLLSLDALPHWRHKPADGPDPERAALERDESALMARLLATLPEDYRLVLVLRYWHDLGYEEIAATLNDTVPAVKSRLHRARRQMAAALADNRQATTMDRPDGNEPADAPATATMGGVISCHALMPST